MKTIQSAFTLAAFLLLTSGCDSMTPPVDQGAAASDEESAVQLTKSQTYDQTRAGARLVMVYDTPSNSFIGTVENTSTSSLAEVRVEIHLSNGTELGPTPSTPLAAGEKKSITLAATSSPFATWSAHPEVGPQGSGGGEGSGEHGGNGGESGSEGGGN